MKIEDRLDQWSAGMRGIWLAGLVTLLAGMSGVFTMPLLDRDEARFVQATTQMLETGDYVNIRYQDQPRSKKPVGIHWMQAMAVSMTSSIESRSVWPFRLPSLLGAVLAAMACAWGAGRQFGSRAGLFAGLILGGGFLLSTEAFIAKTDALLCGMITLSMCCLGQIYVAAMKGEAVRRRWAIGFWIGMAMAALIKGPVGPLIAAMSLLGLWAIDRRAPWSRHMQWGTGLLIVAVVTLPWALAITVATDGAFWGQAIGGDLAPKLAGGQEAHGAPPGYHVLALILLLFPSVLLLPAGIRQAIEHRSDPAIRFAIFWFLPGFLMFELLPTKLIHYTLPMHGALAWLMAYAVTRPLQTWDRRLGAILGGVSALGFLILTLGLFREYGSSAVLNWTAITVGAFGLTGLVGGWFLLRGAAGTALVASLALGMTAHAAFALGFAPGLSDLWVSKRAALAMHGLGLHPSDGLVAGPVTVAGFAEPSLVYQLGTRTGLTGGAQAADALAGGRPALVETRELNAFRTRAEGLGFQPHAVGLVPGLNYSKGDEVGLWIFKPLVQLAPPAPLAVASVPPEESPTR